MNDLDNKKLINCIMLKRLNAPTINSIERLKQMKQKFNTSKITLDIVLPNSNVVHTTSNPELFFAEYKIYSSIKINKGANK